MSAGRPDRFGPVGGDPARRRAGLTGSGHDGQMPPPTPVIIDTDGGVDDAAALWWALTDPTLEVVAVTVVWGNVGLATAATSVARVLAAAGRSDIPVAL